LDQLRRTGRPIDADSAQGEDFGPHHVRGPARMM
jgi:hypothetical protein